MDVGTLFTKTARSLPERIAISYGEHDPSFTVALQFERKNGHNQGLGTTF